MGVITWRGSVSLNDWIPLVSHCGVHQSCNSPCVDLWFSPSGSSWGVVCLVICWNGNMICVSPALKIGRKVINMIYCDLEIGKLKNFYVWMICNVVNVVCCGTINGCNLYRWSVSVMSCPCVAAFILVLWPWVAPAWIMMTWAVVPAKLRLWSGSASPVPVFTVVSWTWPCMATSRRFGFLMSCWGSWRRYPVWTIHDNVTIFVTLIASNMKAISCYMFLFLTLETVIFFVRHHVDCRRWKNCSCELLYSIKLLYFRDCISEHLWSLFIDVGGQTVGILQSFDEDSDGSSIIHEVTSLNLCFKLMDICSKGFLFSLLDLHEAWCVGMDVSIAKFEP